MRRSTNGFTLIELMITVAIVGILASIAIPAYRGSVSRSMRADAKAVLLEDAQFLERNFTESNKYNKDASNNDVVLPYTQSPREGGAQYTISLNAAASTFTLTAAPVSGGSMDGDECGSFTLNQFGQKGLFSATRSMEECWHK